MLVASSMRRPSVTKVPSSSTSRVRSVPGASRASFDLARASANARASSRSRGPIAARLRDDAGALAEALSRANEARDAHGTLRTLEVDDDGTFVTLGLRIDDETSISVVLMFEVRS